MRGTVQGSAVVVGKQLYYDVRDQGPVPLSHIRPNVEPPQVGDEVTVVVAQPVTVLDAAAGLVQTESGIRQRVCPAGLRIVNADREAARAYLALDTWGLDGQPLQPASGELYRIQDAPAGSALDSILRTYALPSTDAWVRIIKIDDSMSDEDKLRVERLMEGLALQAAEPRDPHFAAVLALCSDPVPFALLRRYPRGTLLDKVQQQHAEVLGRWPAIWTQLQEIGETLQRRGILHHNIKLDNLLIKSWDPVELKLADFDQAVVLEPGVDHVRYETIHPLPTMSRQYGATHMLGGGSWPADAADKWSLGMVGFAAYTGTFPAASTQWREALAAAQRQLQTTADYEPLARYLTAHCNTR
jgi:serine/threonine protein kinase